MRQLLGLSGNDAQSQIERSLRLELPSWVRLTAQLSSSLKARVLLPTSRVLGATQSPGRRPRYEDWVSRRTAWPSEYFCVTTAIAKGPFPGCRRCAPSLETLADVTTCSDHLAAPPRAAEPYWGRPSISRVFAHGETTQPHPSALDATVSATQLSPIVAHANFKSSDAVRSQSPIHVRPDGRIHRPGLRPDLSDVRMCRSVRHWSWFVVVVSLHSARTMLRQRTCESDSEFGRQQARQLDRPSES